MGYSKQVGKESDRPLPLDRLNFPAADPREKFEPFEAGVIMPHDHVHPEVTGRYLEAVLVMAACDGGERVFVKFHRSGTTGWINSDRLVDR